MYNKVIHFCFCFFFKPINVSFLVDWIALVYIFILIFLYKTSPNNPVFNITTVNSESFP